MKKKLIIILGLVGLLITMSGKDPCFAGLDFQEVYTSPTGTNLILIVVNSAIYEPIQESLNQYISDLVAEDYRVTLIKLVDGSPQELKDYFKFFNRLNGVILIGDLPVPWFENDDVWGGHSCFPIDLFYMDLDGEWFDLDNDGYYDIHNPGSGDLHPEIWVGRLTASPIFYPDMDEVALLNNYFAKNRAYRTGGLTVNQRALAYPDDDWSGFNDCNLSLAYTDVVVINDKATTNAEDYKNRLKENYEWVHVCVHSSPTLHAFYVPDGSGGLVRSSDIQEIDPIALFYNLFACSNAKYTEADYMGGQYAFARTNGLGAVGSTKTGSMLNFDDFYSHLGPGLKENLGEAYKRWFEAQPLSEGWARSWFYGMTLIGDPTLGVDPPIASIDSILISLDTTGGNQTVTFKGSGHIQNGEIIGYQWRSSIDGYLSSAPSFSTSLSPGEHNIYFKVQDDKGRWSTEDERTINGGRDTIPPTGKIFINNNAAYTKTTSVTLNLSAEDTGGSGLDKMQFSNDNVNWSAPVAYATRYPWTLTTGDGTKRVYARFSDKAGNWSDAPVAIFVVGRGWIWEDEWVSGNEPSGWLEVKWWDDHDKFAGIYTDGNGNIWIGAFYDGVQQPMDTSKGWVGWIHDARGWHDYMWYEEGHWEYTRVIISDTIILDTTPPTVNITSPRYGETVPNTGFAFTGIAKDLSGVTEVRVYVYDYGRETWTVMNEPAKYNSTTNTWGFEVSSTHITPGEQAVLWVRAKDRVGNWSNWQFVMVKVKPDTTPPVVTITSPKNGETVSKKGFVFTGIAQDPSGVSEVRVYVYDYGRGAWTVINELAYCSPISGRWLFWVSSKHITRGKQALLWVRAKDKKDNWSNWQYILVNVSRR